MARKTWYLGAFACLSFVRFYPLLTFAPTEFRVAAELRHIMRNHLAHGQTTGKTFGVASRVQVSYIKRCLLVSSADICSHSLRYLFLLFPAIRPTPSVIWIFCDQVKLSANPERKWKLPEGCRRANTGAYHTNK